jgi:hypothetical protein
MSATLLITTTATVLVAFAGFLATYLNNLRLSQRQERLARLNKQMSDLYGPLFAVTGTLDIAWRTFRSNYRVGVSYFHDETSEATEAEKEAWRSWMINVFAPHNERLYELIVNHTDLLIEDTMPDALLQLCAHALAWRVVFYQWENNDYSTYEALVVYPEKLIPYAQESFVRLKREQAELLGKERPRYRASR